MIEGIFFAPAEHFSTALRPCPQVVYYEIVSWDSSNAADIKALLLSSPQLENLHLVGRKSACIDDHLIGKHDRLPAIKELVLHSHSWDHSPYTSVNFWNWTMVTHLELIKVCVFKFLSVVPPDNLLQLKILVLDECCRCDRWWHRPLIFRTTNMMCTLLDQIQSLVKLSIKGDLRTLLQPAMRHNHSLTSLCLRDCFDRLSPYSHVLQSHNLKFIRIKCHKLTDFTLDIRFNEQLPLPSRPSAFIDNELAMFRGLRRLTVHTNMVQRPPSTAAQSSNPWRYDYLTTDFAVRAWLRSMMIVKSGTKFEKVIVHVGIGSVDVTGLPGVNMSAIMTYTYVEGQNIDNVVGDQHFEWT